ncbi:MAG: Fic family protein [Thermoguttaceae bacterium]|nr:Fic family protein [Thermoguttaceae bacterium]
MENQNRAGHFVQGAGFKTFVPAKLPPNPPIQNDSEMQQLLMLAERHLGQLNGITQFLPNPDLFVAMYVRKEALLSAQIEGTQASFIDVLNAEYKNEQSDDTDEVVNYVQAMNWGLQALETLPICLRLIRNIHYILIQNTRGSDKRPGEFRTSQNWIGTANCDLTEAVFVPPSVPDMNVALNDLEQFFHKEDDMSAIMKIALIHAQFETIHPFLDGNGRIGRLLITFGLCRHKLLDKPLLYLSYYFKQNRFEYYERLMNVRLKGDWEGWIKFFLKGVIDVSIEATISAKNIFRLKEKCTTQLHGNPNSNRYHYQLLDILFERPIIRRDQIVDRLKISNPTAGNVIKTFCDLGLLLDMTPEQNRKKRYLFKPYIQILSKGTELKEES